MTREIRFAILNLTNSVCQIAIYHIELPHLSKVRIRPSVSIFSAKLFRSMLFLFATLFHPSDVERSLVTSDKLLNLKGSVFSLTEKKWQYCQKISVRLLFLREKSYLCREKVAILPKNLHKVKNMQIKRNFYLQQLIDGKILEKHANLFSGNIRKYANLRITCKSVWQISNVLIILPQRLPVLFQAMFVHRPLAADSLPPPKE